MTAMTTLCVQCLYALIFRSSKEKAAQMEWRKQNRRDKYILISRSGFTDEMQKLVSADGVMLVHGDKLGGMMKK